MVTVVISLRGQIPMNETGVVLREFERVGGMMCLDFANTADGDMRGEWTEQLNSYQDLAAWGYQNGVFDAAQAERLIKTAEAHSEAAEAVRQDAIALRLVIYHVFSAIAADTEPDEADLKTLEQRFADFLPHTRLVLAGDHYHWVWAGAEDDLSQVVWPVVWSAVELLQSGQLNRVRECGGNDCSWLFLDTSRNHSRRWCTMESCGNRAKARAHYHRTKGA
jgi:predicted RNA-binding Zn ribbon-like protein